MTAIRTVRAADGNFVILANQAGQDTRLSLQARGIIYYVLSLPPDTHLTAAMIEETCPNGRNSIRTALKELEDHGYYRRTRKSLGRGKWEWDQVISDAPVFAGDHAIHAAGSSHMKPPAETVTSGRNPSDEKSSDENPADKNKDGSPKDENPSPAGAGGGSEDGHDDGALFGAPAQVRKLTPKQEIDARAGILTCGYENLVKVCVKPAVHAIVKRIIQADTWTDDEIAAGLAEVARRNQRLTLEGLRVILVRRQQEAERDAGGVPPWQRDADEDDPGGVPPWEMTS